MTDDARLVSSLTHTHTHIKDSKKLVFATKQASLLLHRRVDWIGRGGHQEPGAGSPGGFGGED